MKYILLILLILFTQTLSAQTTWNSKLVNVNLEDAFSKPQEVLLSRFVDEISFIPLETRQESLVSIITIYEVTDEYIIVKTYGGGANNLLLFDRKTGKFIRKIGKQGRGPGEYFMWIPSVPFNSVKKVFYASSYNSGDILVYDLAGENIDRIKLPDANVRSMRFPTDYLFDENTFIGYFMNLEGNERRKLVLYTKEKIIKIFPNYLTSKGGSWSTYPGGMAKYYKWGNKLNFIEAFCDTLYFVTKESLIPRYYFNWGKYNAPYNIQGEVGRSLSLINSYFFIKDIDENKDYVFLKLVFRDVNYTCFLGKKTNEFIFCRQNSSDVTGLKDDINGLMDVVPLDFTENNEMIYIIEPDKLFAWLKKNPGKASQVRNNLQWINNIDEFSNPIIAIAKCKE